MRNKKFLIFLFGVSSLVAGCEAINYLGPEMTSELFQEMGIDVRPEDVRQFMAAWEQSNKPPLTESEEYYVGRAVAADIFSKYKYYDNYEKNKYISKIGNVLAFYSERPEIYKGYHLGILQTPEKNAYGCPGGFILVTKGAIDFIYNDDVLRESGEDALAGIIAHELAHVALKHPIKTVSEFNKNNFFNVAAKGVIKIGVRSYSDKDISVLGDILGNWVADIMTTIADKGYSRSLENEADEHAVKYLINAGYNPLPFVLLLKKISSGGGGMFATHPYVTDRIENVKRTIARYPTAKTVNPSRTARFRNIFKK